jgi:hypothetical protein
VKVSFATEEQRDRYEVRLLWVFRFFRWYIAAGSNGGRYTRIIVGRVGR